MVNFYFDRLIDGKPYPNLAKHNAKPYTPEWREFSKKWPYSEPVHFLEYLDQENIEYQIVTTPENAIYPVSVSFFDFSVNWFDLMNSAILSALKAKTLKLWFFYSEGDNPRRIQRHLRTQCIAHNIPESQVHFTSANSSADNLQNFSYFADDECLYRLRNTDSPIAFHNQPRSKKFTALVRTHKWWRANTMARLWRQFLHHEGYFSYSKINIGEQEKDNPLIIDEFKNLRSQTDLFLSQCPFKADELDPDTHNLYSTTVEEHYKNSYLHIVLETHLNTDQTNGSFLTEKTFKPIKHAQPFIIIGAPNSINQLKKMGYRTFDNVIDQSYDSIFDSTQRWSSVMLEIERLLLRTDLHKLYQDCKQDIIYNQQLFLSSKRNRLNTLLKKVIDE